MADEARLETIGSMTEAVGRMIDGAFGCRKVAAERLGVEARHLNRMLSPFDNRHFPPDLLRKAMRECNSLLPLEWLAREMGYRLHEKTMTSILEAIRDAMTKDGRDVRFLIAGSGRVEPKQGG